MRHIKLPIRLSTNWRIIGEPVDANGDLLCFWQGSEAALSEVVIAVNAHDELVAVAEIVEALCLVNPLIRRMLDGLLNMDGQSVVEQVKAVLAKVEAADGTH